jgi:hypothetical protein
MPKKYTIYDLKNKSKYGVDSLFFGFNGPEKNKNG